jgi:hypothetical protein
MFLSRPWHLIWTQLSSSFNMNPACIILFIFGSTGVWTQCFALSRKVHYCLSHTFSPFFCGCFGDRVSLFAQASLDSDPPILCFLMLLSWQAGIIHPAFFYSDRVSQTFLPRLAWDHNLPDLSLTFTWAVHAITPSYWLIWGLTNILPRMTSAAILPISASQVARITDVSHWYWFLFVFVY